MRIQVQPATKLTTVAVSGTTDGEEAVEEGVEGGGKYAVRQWYSFVRRSVPLSMSVVVLWRGD